MIIGRVAINMVNVKFDVIWRRVTECESYESMYPEPVFLAIPILSESSLRLSVFVRAHN